VAAGAEAHAQTRPKNTHSRSWPFTSIFRLTNCFNYSATLRTYHDVIGGLIDPYSLVLWIGTHRLLHVHTVHNTQHSFGWQPASLAVQQMQGSCVFGLFVILTGHEMNKIGGDRPPFPPSRPLPTSHRTAPQRREL